MVLIDCFDSFSYNLRDLLQQSVGPCEVQRVDRLRLSHIKRAEAIVLSPGPGTPQDYPILYELLRQYKEDIPFFGVCMGFQVIASFYGSHVTKAVKPLHGKTSTVVHQGHEMFEHIPQSFTITHYHSLCVRQLTQPLISTAKSSDGMCMALAHERLPIWAAQYHPEAILTQYGNQLLENWKKVLDKPRWTESPWHSFTLFAINLLISLHLCSPATSCSKSFPA